MKSRNKVEFLGPSPNLPLALAIIATAVGCWSCVSMILNDSLEPVRMIILGVCIIYVGVYHIILRKRGGRRKGSSS